MALAEAPELAPPRVRVLAFTRLSDDKDGQKKKIGHPAQRRAITELVKRQGWPQVEDADWFADTDTSASRQGVLRPEWDRLLSTLSNIDPSQELPIVVAYAQDRLMRQLGDLPTVANLIESRGGELWTALQGPVSVRKGGRVAYYLSGVVAADEAERISARTTAGLAEAALNGKAHGRPSYGWTRVYESVDGGKPVGRDVVNDEEKAVVVEIANRVIAGESLRGIVNDLNARGVAAPGAGRVRRRDPVTREPVHMVDATWSPTKLRQVVLRKSNIGVRVHRGVEYRAQWEPLVDEGLHAQVVAVLSAPERRTSRSNVARHLLSGIAKCAVCDRTVVAQKHTDGKRTQYRCPRSHVMKHKERTDLVVEAALLRMLADKGVRSSLQRDEDDAIKQAIDDAAAARAKLKELEDAYADDTITLDSFTRLSARVRDRLSVAEAALAQRRDSSVYADLLHADDVGEAWDATPVDRRRAVISALVTVTLHPSKKRGRAAFDPGTIVIERRAH